MSASYQGDHNDFRDSAFNGPFVNEQHIHLPRHEVDWPVQVGTIPEAAAHYQHRAITDRLDQDLHNFGTVVLRQVLSGTGGVGKTQLTAHHARILREITNPDQRVDVLVWANAATRAAITSAYAHAARQLFNTVPEDAEDAARLFLAWLTDPNKHQNRRWLVVWDDLADPAHVRDLWPPYDQPHGRVLVTTRRRDHSLTVQGRHLIDVGAYTPDEAHAFLTRALDTAGIARTEADLNDLAHALGHLPLALGQAVTYMAELAMGCDEYLRVFHDRMNTLSDVFPDWETPAPLAATWDISLSKSDSFSPKGIARPLMSLIALLDGSGFPEEVLTSKPALTYVGALHAALIDADHITEISAHQARATIANLLRLNLITRTTLLSETKKCKQEIKLIGAHQLVQRASREHEITQPNRHGIRALADALLCVWSDTESNASLVEKLIDNTFILKSHQRVEGRTSEEWLWNPSGHELLFRVGRKLGESGRIDEAVAYWKKLRDTAQNLLGHDHLDALVARHNIAHWQAQTGSTVEAIAHFTDLLKDQLRIFGPEHRNTLITRHNIAYWQGVTGDAAAAVKTLKSLLEVELRTLDADDPGILTTRHSIGNLQAAAGDLTGAIANLTDLLSDQLRILGPEHPSTLLLRGNLARWQGDSGDPVSAAVYYEELVDDCLSLLGPEDPRTLIARSNLAGFHGEAGHPERAVQGYSNLLADHLRILGPEHPDTLITRGNLARWIGQTGDHEKAATALSNLLIDQIRILGPEHPDTLTTRGNLVRWKEITRDVSVIAADYEEILADHLRILGNYHPQTLAIRSNYISWVYKTGDTARAVDLLSDLETDQRRILGLNHPSTKMSKEVLRSWSHEREKKDPPGDL
ncbi:tetratricopeptide repeat protein [Nocardiopsis dassonvillei]|uniref:tetratricopeptide repeat protein n=1 Tax=Nocardiopsis dassonvillei TaxID=2014 RepID=UPI0036FAAC61